MSKKNRARQAAPVATSQDEPGSAFGVSAEPTPDPATFDLRAWMSGTALPTRSIDVCAKPHLMGQIQALIAQLDRPEAQIIDERAGATSPNEQAQVEIAEQIEALRTEMLESIVTWKMRALTPDEMSAIKAESPEGSKDEATELDYRVWAAQVVSIDGLKVDVDWTTMRDLHRGGDGVAGLGEYFLRTIGDCANAAQFGIGVSVPFSRRSSSLTRPPQTS